MGNLFQGDPVPVNPPQGRSTVLCINNLAKNIIPEPGFYRTFHYKIHFSPEEIFEIELAVHVMVERLFAFPEGNEHIYVAFRLFLSTDK